MRKLSLWLAPALLLPWPARAEIVEGKSGAVLSQIDGNISITFRNGLTQSFDVTQVGDANVHSFGDGASQLAHLRLVEAGSRTSGGVLEINGHGRYEIDGSYSYNCTISAQTPFGSFSWQSVLYRAGDSDEGPTGGTFVSAEGPVATLNTKLPAVTGLVLRLPGASPSPSVDGAELAAYGADGFGGGPVASSGSAGNPSPGLAGRGGNGPAYGSANGGNGSSMTRPGAIPPNNNRGAGGTGSGYGSGGGGGRGAHSPANHRLPSSVGAFPSGFVLSPSTSALPANFLSPTSFADPPANSLAAQLNAPPEIPQPLTAAPSALVTVPEPGSFVAWGLGLGCVSLFTARRRR